MPSQLDDHDLLIRLDAKLDALTAAFADLKASLSSKADASAVRDLKSRVDSLEKGQSRAARKLNMITGGLIAIEGGIRLVEFAWRAAK